MASPFKARREVNSHEKWLKFVVWFYLPASCEAVNVDTLGEAVLDEH